MQKFQIIIYPESKKHNWTKMIEGYGLENQADQG